MNDPKYPAVCLLVLYFLLPGNVISILMKSQTGCNAGSESNPQTAFGSNPSDNELILIMIVSWSPSNQLSALHLAQANATVLLYTVHPELRSICWILGVHG